MFEYGLGRSREVSGVPLRKGLGGPYFHSGMGDEAGLKSFYSSLSVIDHLLKTFGVLGVDGSRNGSPTIQLLGVSLLFFPQMGHPAASLSYGKLSETEHFLHASSGLLRLE